MTSGIENLNGLPANRITGYGVGTLLVSLLLPLVTNQRSPLMTLGGPAISLVFLILTAIILVIDLERVTGLDPEVVGVLRAAGAAASDAGVAARFSTRGSPLADDLDRDGIGHGPPLLPAGVGCDVPGGR